MKEGAMWRAGRADRQEERLVLRLLQEPHAVVGGAVVRRRRLIRRPLSPVVVLAAHVVDRVELARGDRVELHLEEAVEGGIVMEGAVVVMVVDLSRAFDPVAVAHEMLG